MNPEAFSQIASGIQSLVVTAAALVGGIWALYRFGSLKEVEKARADLEQVRKSLRERGIFDIRVRAERIGVKGNPGRFVVISAQVHNSGNRTEVIDWSKSGIFVTRVSVDTQGNPQFGPTLGVKYLVPDQDVPASSVLPNQTRDLPFLVPLAEDGIYHLNFRATLSPLEDTVHREDYRVAGVDEPEGYVWQSSIYFSVE